MYMYMSIHALYNHTTVSSRTDQEYSVYAHECALCHADAAWDAKGRLHLKDCDVLCVRCLADEALVAEVAGMQQRAAPHQDADHMQVCRQGLGSSAAHCRHQHGWPCFHCFPCCTSPVLVSPIVWRCTSLPCLVLNLRAARWHQAWTSHMPLSGGGMSNWIDWLQSAAGKEQRQHQRRWGDRGSLIPSLHEG